MDVLDAPIPHDHRLSLDHCLRVSIHGGRGPVPARPHRADIHYALHLGIVIEGSMRVVHPGADWCAEPGDVWLTSCWEPHAGERQGDPTTVVLCTALLETLRMGDLFGAVDWVAPFLLSPASRPRVPAAARQRVLGLGNRLHGLASQDDPLSEAESWLLFRETLLVLLREMSGSSTGAGRDELARIRPAIDLVRKQGAEPVTLESAATACNLARSRFCDLFRGTMGISFGQFALRARLAGAAQALRGTKRPVKAVACRFGFHDSSHFNHMFKKHVGCTPLAYRRRS